MRTPHGDMAAGVIVAAAGDISCPPADNVEDRCRQQATSDLLVAMEPSAVLPLGDNQYPTGALEDYLRDYDPTWGRLKSVSHPTPGNHEYLTRGAAGYFEYFGSFAGPPGRGYYSFELGSWHAVSLNSEIDATAGSPQERWLRQDLQQSDAACTIAFWHRPLFSSGVEHGGSSTVADLWVALHEADSEIVLNAHEHNYERFAPQTPTGASDPDRGLTQFVVGTGGGNVNYGFGEPLPNSRERITQTFGVLQLTLGADRFSWRFVPLHEATFQDSGSGPCH